MAKSWDTCSLEKKNNQNGFVYSTSACLACFYTPDFWLKTVFLLLKDSNKLYMFLRRVLSATLCMKWPDDNDDDDDAKTK